MEDTENMKSPNATDLPGSSSEYIAKTNPLSETFLGKRKHEDEVSNWESGDWRDYMSIKQRKLRDQFRGLSTPYLSSIFEGVTIYVNGWTQPTADELKEMIHTHGGSYEANIYSNSKVTHTIATNLPNAKIKNLGTCTVCTPDWIVDSIKACKRLPVDKYLLYSRTSTHQKVLTFDNKVKDRDGSSFVDVALGQPEVCASSPAQPSSTSLDQQLSNNAPNGSTSEEINQYKHLTPSLKSYRPSHGEKFVSDFFTHSRLHHLSTWSTELKQFTAKMVKEVTPQYPKLNSSCSIRKTGQRAVVHIDLDCFFVSVSIRDKPHLAGKPVGITHAKLLRGRDLEPSPTTRAEDNKVTGSGMSPKNDGVNTLLDSTSDIASCSYAARNMGVHNGMTVGQAMKLCPNIILLPYDFESYRKVSQEFYECLLLSSSCVEAVSCDEAFVEFTDYVVNLKQVEDIVLEVRGQIELKTGCTVSAGISGNMLLARMSTRVAKPNGQFYLPLDQAEDFLKTQSVGNLPGVGYSTSKKLKDMNVVNCMQLLSVPLEKLQVLFGVKTGKVLYEYARGIDCRELKTSSGRKTVSVDINYGIRFTEISQAESLVRSLAIELEKRATEAQVVGGTVILKMKVRRQTAPKETWKYLGHGVCDNITRSFALLQPTKSSLELSQLGVRLLKQIRPDPSDIRGMGLQLSKLLSTSSDNTVGHTSSLGADLRTFMKPDSGKEKIRTTDASAIESISMTPPPLCSTAPANEQVTNLTCHHRPSLSLKSAHPTPARCVPMVTSIRASNATPSSDITDESFVIDLPPMSQLDNSVLDALPAYIKEKILIEYANKNANKKSSDPTLDQLPSVTVLAENPSSPKHNQTLVKSVTDQGDTNWCVEESLSTKLSSLTNPLIIDNEATFIKEVRSYVREWILNCLEGPTVNDMHMVSDYLLKLTNSNLYITSLALKSMRRFIVELELVDWFSAFNELLSIVQLRVTAEYGGELLIPSL